MRVVVVGATSALVQETIRRCARAGDELLLTGRNLVALNRVADDARRAGATSVHVRVLDLGELRNLAPVWEDAWQTLVRVDALLIAAGTLPDEDACRTDPIALEAAIRVNTVAPASLAALAAHQMVRAGGGVVAVVSSVAGDRGRASNYAYGATKKALSTCLEGLGHDIRGRGVRVVDVRPGMVDTPMTRHLKRSPLLADPNVVGARIFEALHDRSRVVYSPSWWRPVMWVVRSLPRPIFERLRF